MIDPKLYASTPHRNFTAYTDLVGSLMLVHAQVLAPTIQKSTRKAVPLYPLDALANPRDMLSALQSQLNAETSALGIAAAADIQSFDLRDPSEWASWTFLISQEHERIRKAAGVT